ncbi:hypothetical protein B0H16DRAFT_394967 [Mycena metata]|uniref:Annexin n=1 Tax=Mycena metata TaxID=1033252 RepID=A0AAD7HG89_9AGAR|nr:hypothetical protein B0H16DRAFT_394967 [Mycena metata]
MIYNPKLSGGTERYDTADADIKAILDSHNVDNLIAVLARLGPLKMEIVDREFPSHPDNIKGTTLQQLIKGKTQGNSALQDGLLGLSHGPLKSDVIKVHDAMIIGSSTKDSILHEITLELTPRESNLLAYVYHKIYKAKLWQRIREAESGDSKELLQAVFDPRRQLLPASNTTDAMQLTIDDVQSLNRISASHSQKEKRHMFISILTGRTRPHLARISKMYQEKYGKSLSQLVQSQLEGDYRSALLFVAQGINTSPKYPPDLDPRALRDARRLEETMAGVGINKDILAMRVLRAHWSRERMDSLIEAFPHVNEKHLQLRDRVTGKGEKGMLGKLRIGNYGQAVNEFKFLILVLISEFEG